MTSDIAALCKQYCGAVAVSWYRSNYTLRAIQLLLDVGVKTNIHYVLGRDSIEEAIERLKENAFPRGINAVIFLLHKPVGQGTNDNVLNVNDDRVVQFFAELDRAHPYKTGLDSCNVPGAVNYCKNIITQSMDTCEGARFSCYIDSDLVMLPCSFDQRHRFAVQLRPTDIETAWNSDVFDGFRNHLYNSCPDCEYRNLCKGGCPLMPEIVLCRSD